MLRACYEKVCSFFGVRVHAHRPHAPLYFADIKARFARQLAPFVQPLGPDAQLTSMTGDELSDGAVDLGAVGASYFRDMFSTLVVKNEPYAAPAKMLLRKDAEAAAAAAAAKRQAKVDATRAKVAKQPAGEVAESLVALQEQVEMLKAQLEARQSSGGDESEEPEADIDDELEHVDEAFAPFGEE